VLAGVFYLSSREVDNQTSSSVFNNEKLEHFSNETNKPTLLKLSDGSTVLLQPTATLQYPKEFGTGKREVLLQGDGFFDIARNDQKPFYVYCNNIITKVLGTSFNVGVNKTTGDVEVSVKKGKVQVYTQDEKGETSRMSAVILTPNHKAIYNRSKNVLQATVSDHPLPIAAQNNREKPANAKPILVFEQEKMAVVLKHLQEYFGIQMAVENETFNNCLFSGDLSEGDLYDQLHIIRLTMKAEFEVNGTTILIKGSGCSD
jgi:ferric-dicitrate binding protein FerR (iron transport regulator)